MPMNKTYSGPSDLPATIPLFPLAGALLLPGGQLPLNIFEPRYLAMFDDAMRGERIIGMIQPVEGADTSAGERPALRAIGSAGRITQLSETGDGRYFVILSGISRFRILSEVDSQKPYREAWADFSAFPEDFVAGAAVPAQRRSELNNVAFDLAQALRMEIARNDVESMPDADMISVFAMIGPFDHDEKQALLEAPGLLARADLLLALGEVALSRAVKGAKPLQ